MIRTRLPGGLCTPAQWLALDALATRYANGTLRLTSRQAFQLHGVLKGDLKPTIAAMNAALVDTIAACGDVNRNVLATPGPAASPRACRVATVGDAPVRAPAPAHPRLPRDLARRREGRAGAGARRRSSAPTTCRASSRRRSPCRRSTTWTSLPRTSASSRSSRTARSPASTSPRAAASARPMAMPKTYPRLADVIGFLTPGPAAGGGRSGGHHAARLRRPQRTQARAPQVHDRRPRTRLVPRGTRAAPRLRARSAAALRVHDARATASAGHEDAAGRWHLTLRIESGRVADRGDRRLRSGIARIAQVHRGHFRLTPNQNLVIADVAGRRPLADRRAGRRLWTRCAPHVKRRRARVARLRRAADLPAGDGRGRALPARAGRAARCADGAARPRRRAAALSRERLPERLLAAVPRRNRARRQGARPLQPAPGRRPRWPAPRRALPREPRRTGDPGRARSAVRRLGARSARNGEAFGDFLQRSGRLA